MQITDVCASFAVFAFAVLLRVAPHGKDYPKSVVRPLLRREEPFCKLFALLQRVGQSRLSILLRSSSVNCLLNCSRVRFHLLWLQSQYCGARRMLSSKRRKYSRVKWNVS